MQNTKRLLFSLIRSSISGEPVNAGYTENCDFSWITQTAKSHDILQIIADAIIKNNLSSFFDGGESVLKKEIFVASYRDSKNRHTFDLVCEILSRANIDFVPMKGAVIKKMYPESWLRSSCDIDILVRKEDFNRAVSVLQSEGFKSKGKLNYHDLSLIYDDTNLELHFSIQENIQSVDGLLSEVWNNVNKSEGFMFLETNEYFVFHHIAHMMHHFVTGGCGIRPFIDIWILKRNKFYDENTVQKLCEQVGLCEFYNAICEVVQVWFEDKPSSKMTERVQDYILYGGVYGNYPNNHAVNTVNSGGKIKSIIKSAFPGYQGMCVPYPILRKAPVLLPFCYLHRLYVKLIGHDSKRAKKRVVSIIQQDEEFIKNIRYLFDSLNLKK